MRSRNPNTRKPLYFDYLGRARDRTPALLVEAKKFDSELPHQPNEPVPSPREVSRLLSRELGDLKSGGNDRRLLAEWTAWLNDLVNYVRSMSQEDQKRLARVAITAGQWLIVFKTPEAAFVQPGAPDPDCILCYRSFEEMQQGSDEIFELLNRDNLIDTLPLTMRLGEALAVLDPGDIKTMFRGVVVSTQMVGPQKGIFPLRTVIPAVILASDTRVFAVAQYGLAKPLSEPSDEQDLKEFLDDLKVKGAAFQNEVLTRFRRPDLEPRPAAECKLTLQGAVHAPMPASTAALTARKAAPPPSLGLDTGEHGGNELLVVTGLEWFYKLEGATTEACELHFYPRAKSLGAAGPNIGQRGSVFSFTSSGEAHHCEDLSLREQRQARCHLRSLETHMCCRACAFNSICSTPEESASLRCPK